MASMAALMLRSLHPLVRVGYRPTSGPPPASSVAPPATHSGRSLERLLGAARVPDRRLLALRAPPRTIGAQVVRREGGDCHSGQA